MVGRLGRVSDRFSIQRALELARRRIMMCMDYAVSGTGPTHRSQSRDPAVVWLSEGEQVRRAVYGRVLGRPGESYRLPFDDSAALRRTDEPLAQSTELADAQGQTSLPVIYDGEFRGPMTWPRASGGLLRRESF
ncbi:hypothetical protein C8039_05235 [Halogeometricum sp. wsp3]|nr:hypothetical protein C8039_05235 [Halogeometricum sp. wsp3]